MIKYSSRKSVRKFGELDTYQRTACTQIVNALESAAAAGLSLDEVMSLIKEAVNV